MPWVAIEPKYKRGDIDHAGRVLAQDQKPDLFEYQKALEIAGNWRSSHNWPLNIFQASLRARARKVSSKALIAQRLKRLTSIEVKLRRFPTMNLSQMQDLGGCRAVMNNAGQAYTLAAAYEHNDAKNRRRHEFVNKKDYIAEPKSDGYRGIHLVYRYRTEHPRYQKFNGHRIEIQIRSQLQHAWATAVETVDTFTGQALKSSAGINPQSQWARFFLLMSAAIARRERMPIPKGVPARAAKLKSELRTLAKQLKVHTTFRGWQGMVKYHEEVESEADLYLLTFDIDNWQIQVNTFTNGQQDIATRAYLNVEKAIRSGENKQAVLVGVESVQALRKAYPSYFIDTDAFLDALALAIKF